MGPRRFAEMFLPRGQGRRVVFDFVPANARGRAAHNR